MQDTTPQIGSGTGPIRVESLADNLDTVGTIAKWHWDEWGHTDPEGSVEAWTAGLAGRANRDRVPATYVALLGEEPVGSVTLVEHDMSTHLNLTPWIAGVFVKPERRGMKMGTLLMRHACAEAAKMGIRKLYLYTASAEDFYSKLGWRRITYDNYEGRQVAIMALDL